MKGLWGLILFVATLPGSASAQTHTAIIPLSPDGEPGVGLTGEGNSRSHTFFRSDGNERVAVWESDGGAPGPSYTLEYTEFVYVLEGSLMLTDARGRKETFRPGDAVLLPRGTEVTWEQDERMREYYVIFDVEESDEESSADGEPPTFIRLDPNGGADGLTGEGLTKSHTYFLGPNRSSVGVWETAPQTDSEFFTPPFSEVMIFLSGTVTMTQPDGSEHTFGAGDAVLVPKGATHKWSSDTLRKFWITFDQEPRSETSAQR